jgi:hypothetical protein
MSNANAALIDSFFSKRTESGDWQGLLSRDRRTLCRKAILLHCKFPRSTLYQNYQVKEIIQRTEEELRKRGVLLSEPEYSRDMPGCSEELVGRMDLLSAEIDELRSRVMAADLLVQSIVGERG